MNPSCRRIHATSRAVVGIIYVLEHGGNLFHEHAHYSQKYRNFCQSIYKVYK